MTRHFRSSWDMYDRHLYPGGACRLHTLRCELGDAVFWDAVRAYLQRYNGKVVETDDFRLIMEELSGRSLGRFFDQWFHTPGYPDLKVSFRHDAEKQQGIFEIEQTQVDPAKQIPVFVLHTDLGWTSAGVTYSQPIRLEQARQVFAVPMAQAPEQVRFDPFNKVLHKLSFNPGDDLLRRQLTDAPDVLGRIHAAVELAKTGRRPNIAAVTAAYAQESFWGVRCEMANGVGRGEHGRRGRRAGRHGPAANKIRWCCPKSSTLRPKSARRELRDAILARLETGGLGYYATQAAYEALGAQREAAPYDLLAAAARQPSFNGVVQAGALRGLAATRRKEAVDVLLAAARYGGASIYARPAAVAALGALGPNLEKRERERVIEALLDLLRDPAHQVALAAVHSLGAMNATEAMDTLEIFARTRVVQEAAVVERTVEKLRQADKADGSALQKQVETLTDRVRRLEDEIDQLKAG